MDSGRTAVPDPLPENIANGNRTESMVLENSTVSNPLSEPQLLSASVPVDGSVVYTR